MRKGSQRSAAFSLEKVFFVSYGCNKKLYNVLGGFTVIIIHDLWRKCSQKSFFWEDVFVQNMRTISQKIFFAGYFCVIYEFPVFKKEGFGQIATNGRRLWENNKVSVCPFSYC